METNLGRGPGPSRAVAPQKHQDIEIEISNENEGKDGSANGEQDSFLNDTPPQELQSIPNINEIDKIHLTGQIHVAAKAGDENKIKELIKHKDCNLDLLSLGDTALLIAIKELVKVKEDSKRSERYQNIIKTLLGAKCNPNIPDRQQKTPIYIAAEYDLEKITKLLLDIKNIDIDSYKYENRSARNLMEEAGSFPEILKSKIVRDSSVDVYRLFAILNTKNEEGFLKCFTVFVIFYERYLKDIMYQDEGEYTLLQLACLHGMNEAVDRLLKYGADPNYVPPHHNRSPAELACEGGEYISHGMTKNKICKDLNTKFYLKRVIMAKNKRDLVRNNKDNYNKCRQFVLNSKKSKDDNTKFCDPALNTWKRQDILMKLLEHGAYMGPQYNSKILPLTYILPSTLKNFLDNNVTLKGQLDPITYGSVDEYYDIVYKYHCLIPPESKDGFSALETDTLIRMEKNPTLRPLLLHPLITSFIWLKWQKIEKILYIYFACIFLFWLSLIIHIIYDSKPFAVILWIFFIIKEIIEATSLRKKYLKSVINLLEIGLVIMTLASFILQSYIYRAMAILYSTVILTLYLGYLPFITLKIEMLKLVTRNFLEYFMSYGFILLAYAMSFYALFHPINITEDNKRDSNATVSIQENSDVFLNFWLSSFKTVIMMTGEFGSEAIPFDQYTVIAHIIFTTFVFMVAIVLTNLLSGLAVGDIQAIRDDAELLGHVSRIRLLSYFERIFCTNSNFVMSYLARRITIFREMPPTIVLRIYNGEPTDVICDNGASGETKNKSNCEIIIKKMGQTVINNTIELLNNKNTKSDSYSLDEMRSHLNNIVKTVNDREIRRNRPEGEYCSVQ